MPGIGNAITCTLLDCNNGKKLPHAFMTLFPMLEESRDAIKRMREFINSDFLVVRG